MTTRTRHLRRRGSGLVAGAVLASAAVFATGVPASAAPAKASHTAGTVTVDRPDHLSNLWYYPVEAQVLASSTTPGALRYAASGLPTGLAIEAATGLITGEPRVLGDWEPRITVTDAAGGTGSTSFFWSIDNDYNLVHVADTDRVIPDGGEVLAPLDSDFRTGTVHIDVDVVTDHTDRGQLAIDLIDPTGFVYTVKKANPNDHGVGLRKKYELWSTWGPAGTWKLRIRDTKAGSGTGTLDQWRLTYHQLV
ncbi:proprotein convertase P-domain-containing protein [Streptomyces sp. NPDC087420]|uniref:proprotein convertase P-domain-containing protein n=1 Tax=Streptomyces sp. NPDC087420 TaxID=3365785 RepID=UPI003833DF8C